MRKIILLLAICVAVCGCARTSQKTLLQNHQNKLQELDAQYKSGRIDAVQYQVKYSAEVEDYNSQRITAKDLIGNGRQ